MDIGARLQEIASLMGHTAGRDPAPVVDLIVERSPNMSVYDAETRDLQSALKSRFLTAEHRAFNWPSFRENPALYSADKLLAPDGLLADGKTHLVIVATDGTSPRLWYTPQSKKIFEQWSESALVIIANVLPRFAWERTPLYQPLGSVTLPASPEPSEKPAIEWYWWNQVEPSTKTPMPCLPLDNAASFMANLDGLIFKAVETEISAPHLDPAEDAVGSSPRSQLPAQTIVDNLHHGLVANESRALAVHLSALKYFTLPQMQQVQACLSPASSKQCLTDILCSRVLTVEVPAEGIDPSRFVFSMRPDVRGLLSRGVYMPEMASLKSAIPDLPFRKAVLNRLSSPGLDK